MVIIIIIIINQPPCHLSMTVTLQVSAEKVVYTFCMRAHYLGLKQINCAAEELYEEAIETAKALDKGSTTSTTQRLLEGVPVSIKECIQVKGCDSTCGLAVRTFRPYEVSALNESIL